MQGHTGEVFVLESHPSDSRILLSAGHDGLVILWDMLAGVKLKTLNLEEDGAITCIFDCKFSPDGLTCAAADSSGYLTVMGFDSSEPYKKVFTVHSCMPYSTRPYSNSYCSKFTPTLRCFILVLFVDYTYPFCCFPNSSFLVASQGAVLPH